MAVRRVKANMGKLIATEQAAVQRLRDQGWGSGTQVRHLYRRRSIFTVEALIGDVDAYIRLIAAEDGIHFPVLTDFNFEVT